MVRFRGALIVVLVAACGDDPRLPGPATPAAGQADAGPSDAVIRPFDGGSLPPASAGAPGPPTADLAATGAGPCAAHTLGQVIAALHAAHPELADITAFNDPPGRGNGSWLAAFAVPGGFAVAFKRGDADCPSGCLDNEYWYFQTDAACAPQQVGHYHSSYTYQGNCFTLVGSPLWGFPAPGDPATACGADNQPVDISGTYHLHAAGTRTPCQTGAAPTKTDGITRELTMTIVQTPGDLADGTVTLAGTGEPRVDGVPLPGMFARQRFTAFKDVTNLPAVALDEYGVVVQLDLEGTTPGTLRFHEARGGQTDYCKGELQLQLTLAR
jgi:hypothetical protein